ncbi:adenylosuccinate lyase [Candidatus Magnetobacterium casense]|uniref:Adenylosuccinate lyase n=1 Tax=Candidatus Magnetobacterium casense TaxID=1455061 RepID=A0ABS6RWH1_9BACT|nr:adenylosuccinate lyase [Candidatus Magnetobacterium casensis]MBV6340613.1 adenylosuccinate lyase [Candidatus Magnetobacterium casensis]
MIDRYARKQMRQLWELPMKYRKWLDVELAVCEAFAQRGVIPQGDMRAIRERAGFDVDRIAEIELTVKHDVIAFLTSVSEHVGESGRFIHMGLTSSDILDTSLALLMRDAADIIINDIASLLLVLKEQAFNHKDTVCIGRSHGIHAEPMVFGLKFSLWYEEMRRNVLRMQEAQRVISVGKLSGAVGTFSSIEPDVEEGVLKRLGLTPEPVATQVVQRDRHAQYLTTLAIVASTIEKIAVEIRHLQRTEVREAEEPFSVGQKGSSAMPHKRNPIGSENLSGLARVVRANVQAALENVALWHERDISHSSVERIIIPDSTILVDYMLNRLKDIIMGLVVYPQAMQKNLARTLGLYNSQKVLLALIEKGLSRETAYATVQRLAMQAWQEEADFRTLLANDNEIKTYLTPEALDELFDVRDYLKHVDYIYSRVFKH